MSSRRRPPPDMAAVKKSRAAFTGAITRANGKVMSIPQTTQEAVRGINPKDIERILLSLERTEKGYRQSIEDAQDFSPSDETEEEQFQEEEDEANDQFFTSLALARDGAEQVLTLKRVLNGLGDFRTDLAALQESLEEKPDTNQEEALQSLNKLYMKLREDWQNANLYLDHPIKTELDSCRKILTCLGADVATAKSKSDSHSTSLSSISASTHSSSPGCCSFKSDLPVIDVPKFYGNIMTWSTFWASFESTIGQRKDLDDTKRLHYLRMAIKDDDAKKLLYSPTETPAFYGEVVEELKRRFDRTKEVHRELTRSILELQTPKQTRTDLRRMTDQVKRTINSLKATGFYTIEALLCSTVYLLLPQKLQTLWDQHTRKDKGVPSVNRLLDFIQDHAEALPITASTPHKESESPAKRPCKNATSQPKGSSKGHVNTTSVPSTVSTYKWDCILCKTEKHPLHSCPKWAAFTVPQRLNNVKSKNLCTNCLAGGHILANCKSIYRCRSCGQQHHTTLHQETAATTVNNASATSHQVPDALMTTAQVLLTGPRGQELQARALIDSGAGLSIISHRVAQKLGLPLTPRNLQLTGVQGVNCKPSKFVTTLAISPTFNKQKKIKCNPVVVKLVTGDLPAERLNIVHDMDHLVGLQLADPNYNIPDQIDILLGADLAPQIMTKQVLRTGTESQPMAQATEFGWVVSGPATRADPSSAIHAANITHLQTEEPLNNLIQQFWFSEEAPGDEEISLSDQEKQAESHYLSNLSYSSHDSRYQVTLPKKPELFPLGDSKTQAVNRYLSNERSLLRKNVWEPFQAVVQQYLDLGHAEEVPPSDSLPVDHFYLPMHAVFKDSSSSTKLRVVFDGSAPTTSGVSLNQALLVGPTLQPTLSNILLQFRTYPIALNADISKMYREVLLSPSDKDLHRFVWRASPSGPILDYRMCRVTFGVSASPFLAVRTLQQTAKDHGEEYPRASQLIINNFYVDDFLGGTNTPQEALQLFTELRDILQKGGFNLIKWRSSSPEVLQNIPPELQEAAPIKDSTSDKAPTVSKALGLVWDSERDVMSPAINVSTAYIHTKRGLYGDVAKTYDVLGWISPTVILMKILFQDLWRTGQDWDESIPTDLSEQHSRWRTELPILKQRTLPRCYWLVDKIPIITELHAFCDASMKAFGAVIYCRTTYQHHPPVISLVTAKTKVASIKPSTVPRLELCGAVLLVKLLTAADKSLEIPSEHWHAWTDSSIVLAWLDGQPRQFKTYVSNRVSFILQGTSPNHWKHVPTGENPADCSSRGMMPAELLQHSLWWEGPAWLQQDPYPEPHQPPRRTLQPMEMRTIHLTIPNYSISFRIQQKSASYYSSLATSAWVLRFKDRLINGRPDPDTRNKYLTGSEVTRARDWLLKENQLLNFPKEIKALQRGQPIPPSSRLRALNPFLDSTKLLRVGGRLANSVLSHSQQHPAIADSKDTLIIQWFQHLHLSLCHCGPSLLLSYAGNHLHILGARQLSRTVCSQCTICRRVAPTWPTQLMGDLPAARVTPVRAFFHTGMDFAGPFTIKMGYVRKPTKLEAYLCIFVCLTYKAIHLEVVSNTTTQAFQACLRRFISRRNCPEHIYSDNGPNFTGAKNNLKKLYSWLQQQDTDESIRHYLLSQHNITWHNSPPASPHFGGLWESGVRSTKKHLKRVVGTSVYTFEELTTIACQIEACLNSRPLLPITSHNQDGLVTLTASHFLLYDSPSSYPEDPRLPANPDLLKKWGHCQAVIQHFWQRWSREYLSTLQLRNKWQHSSPNLQVGDIVILRHEKTFSCHWPLARMTAVFPGQDGLVRVAEVKTATGTYTRPIVKLALLHRPTAQEPLQPLPPGGCSDNNQLAAASAQQSD